MGRPSRGRQAVGGGYHHYASSGHEWSSTRPARHSRKKSKDCRDGQGLEALQYADTPPEEGPDERQQLQQQWKPKQQLKLQPQLHPAAKPMLTPTHTRCWETVPPRAQSQRAANGLGVSPNPTAGSSIAERCVILRRDNSVLHFNKMD